MTSAAAGGCSSQAERLEEDYNKSVDAESSDEVLCEKAREIADSYLSEANSERFRQWSEIADVKCAPKAATISGELSYPSDYLPEDMQVCARNVETREDQCEATGGEPTYSMDLQPGTYIVWAETPQFGNTRAFYSKSVVCGLSVECTDHRPIEVNLESGAKVSQIDPQDWYANN